MKQKFNLKLEMRRVGEVIETYDQEGKTIYLADYSDLITNSWKCTMNFKNRKDIPEHMIFQVKLLSMSEKTNRKNISEVKND